MNLAFRLFLTFNATSLLWVVFLVKEQVLINRYSFYFLFLPSWVSYCVYLAVPVLFTYISLLLSRLLPEDSIDSEGGKSPIVAVEQANNAYLPSYLGYFFVALGVPQGETLIFVFIILFVFTFLSQSLYFNPLFLVFGYHFFYLTTETNVKIFLVTRRNLKRPRGLVFTSLRRVNDFTFIDNDKS